MGLELRDSDIALLNELADSEFDISESIANTKEIIKEISSNHHKNEITFESNEWKVVHSDSAVRLTLDFQEISNNIRFNANMNKEEKLEFVLVVKCWAATLLNSLDIYSVHRYLRYLNEVVVVSDCFNTAAVEKTVDYINTVNNETKHKAFITCLGVLNFLDYYENIDENSVYLKRLLNLKEEIGNQENIRTLPSPKDVFLFNEIFEEYFGSLSRESDEFIYYFPVYLWWNLTNLIPLRPFEFCGISRDALLPIDDNYYIKLPRSDKKGSKSHNRNRIQIVDTIKIPNSLGKEIDFYIEHTKVYGGTDTLISIPAYQHFHYKLHNHTISDRKIDNGKYSVAQIYRDINRFYKDIVSEKYGKTIRPRELTYNDDNIKLLSDSYDISEIISCGDTRHFAFLNLMRLGYSPVEIARLGGHLKLDTQYHYHNHKEFLLNIEVLKLMNKFRYDKSDELSKNKTIIDVEINSVFKSNFGIDGFIKKRFVEVPTPIDTKPKKLEIGFCVDPYQRCKVHDCSLCDSWRISIDEFKQNKNLIQAKVESAYNQIQNLLSTIEKIHNFIINRYGKSPDADDLNLETNRDLTMISKKLNIAIEQYIELLTIEHRKVLTENE